MDGEFVDPNKPSKASIDLLSGILLGFALLATVIIALLVDPLTRYYNFSNHVIKEYITQLLNYNEDTERISVKEVALGNQV